MIRASSAPELALGEHLVLGEELHAADLRDRVLLRRRRTADDLVLVHTARERPYRKVHFLEAWTPGTDRTRRTCFVREQLAYIGTYSVPSTDSPGPFDVRIELLLDHDVLGLPSNCRCLEPDGVALEALRTPRPGLAVATEETRSTASKAGGIDAYRGGICTSETQSRIGTQCLLDLIPILLVGLF